MDVLVPFAVDEPKTRLSTVFSPEERAEFARVMLADVCSSLESVGASPIILSTGEIDCAWPVVVDDRPLSEAVNDRLAPPIAVVMADLALVTPEALSGLFDAEGDIVIAPGLGGGTNALVVRHPGFHTDYHGISVRDHQRIAEDLGIDPTMIDSFRLAVDVDEHDDLAEVLLHGDGKTAEWLRGFGFEIVTTGGRVTVCRSPA